MIRSIKISFAILIFGLLSCKSHGQITEPGPFISLFQNLYSFNFDDAKTDLDHLHAIDPDPDLLDIGMANYHWWLINTQRKSEEDRSKMLASLERIISRYENMPPGDLNPDQLFAITHAYAYKTRLDMHEKNYLKGAGNLNKTVQYLDIILPNAEDNPKFMLLAGIYHYVAGSIHEKFPLYRPLLALGPKTEMEKGLAMLRKCAQDKHPMIRTEARYFIMVVKNLIKEDNIRADWYARKLLKEYPKNSYFRFWRITILADAGKFKETRYEYFKLRSNGEHVQHTQSQQSFLISESEKYLRKKNITF